MKSNEEIKRFADEAIVKVREQVGDGRVLLALSGGVDSSVCAALISRAVGSKLTCIFVDTGLMRKNEADEVEAAFKGVYDINFIRVEAEDRYLAKLKGVTDPEQKRKIIGEEFIRIFEEEAGKLGRIDYLAQGTIYPDIIESGQDGAKFVKSHHNVGGLPEHVDFKGLVEPLRDLYKDEVRAVGRELGLPDALVDRQPFPGPGLGVRCLPECNKENLDILREADYIFRDEIAKSGLSGKIWQYFAVLTDIRSTGVRDGARCVDRAIALRAVNTTDAVTATWAKVPLEVLERVSARITAEVPQVNRVLFDITAKPPATIEFE